VTDRQAFRPVLTGAALVSVFRDTDPERFTWREPPYEYERVKLPFDILAGSSQLREQIERGVAITDIAASWEPEIAAFKRLREQYLLYS
jgi:uncharacterized protein YbbC (DUF1343 family)